MTQKEILMTYIANNRDRLQEDVRELQQRVRYRDVDPVDCLELSLAIERLTAFENFSRSVIEIMKLSVPDPVTYVSIDGDYARHRIEKERNKGK